ncbi:hypothetical protein RvY_10976 [Ramazzottius varieornatus]|uniref:Receptor ligand binding region domain-containing protein n=1 Tax=Ramazzottius varieornatus TaxID=947166 RepID=A0A1D1VEJ3_RAMVA|nr:hypothetical protein RvY_10976 [Ramazzottius varieornatus]
MPEGLRSKRQRKYTEDSLKKAVRAVASIRWWIAQVINETVTPSNHSASIEALRDGVSIAQKFFNRTFILPTGNIHFSPTGQRQADMLVKQYNFTTGKFESILRYVHRTSNVTFPFGRRFVWNNGKPALAEPVCGFENDKCRSNDLLSAALPAAVAIGVILSASTLATWSLKRRSHADGPRWWLLDSTDFLTLHKRKSISSRGQASPYLKIV